MNWPPTEQLESLGYDEFACSEIMARELMAGGMTHVNGRPVYLTHSDTMPDGRWILHVHTRVAALESIDDVDYSTHRASALVA